MQVEPLAQSDAEPGIDFPAEQMIESVSAREELPTRTERNRRHDVVEHSPDGGLDSHCGPGAKRNESKFSDGADAPPARDRTRTLRRLHRWHGKDALRTRDVRAGQQCAERQARRGLNDDEKLHALAHARSVRIANVGGQAFAASARHSDSAPCAASALLAFASMRTLAITATLAAALLFAPRGSAQSHPPVARACVISTPSTLFQVREPAGLGAALTSTGAATTAWVSFEDRNAQDHTVGRLLQLSGIESPSAEVLIHELDEASALLGIATSATTPWTALAMPRAVRIHAHAVTAGSMSPDVIVPSSGPVASGSLAVAGSRPIVAWAEGADRVRFAWFDAHPPGTAAAAHLEPTPIALPGSHTMPTALGVPGGALLTRTTDATDARIEFTSLRGRPRTRPVVGAASGVITGISAAVLPDRRVLAAFVVSGRVHTASIVATTARGRDHEIGAAQPTNPGVGPRATLSVGATDWGGAVAWLDGGHVRVQPVNRDGEAIGTLLTPVDERLAERARGVAVAARGGTAWVFWTGRNVAGVAPSGGRSMGAIRMIRISCQ